MTQLLALGSLQKPDVGPASRLPVHCRFLSPLGFPRGRGGLGSSCWCPGVGRRFLSSFSLWGSVGEASPLLFQVLLWVGWVRPLGPRPENSGPPRGRLWWQTMVAPPRWPQPLRCVPVHRGSAVAHDRSGRWAAQAIGRSARGPGGRRAETEGETGPGVASRTRGRMGWLLSPGLRSARRPALFLCS